MMIMIDSWGRFMDGPASDLRSNYIDCWQGFHCVRDLNENHAVFTMHEDEFGCSWVEVDVFWTLFNKHIANSPNYSSERISNSDLLESWGKWQDFLDGKVAERPDVILSGHEIATRTEYFQGDRRRIMFVLEENLQGDLFLYQATLIALGCTSNMKLIGYYMNNKSFIIEEGE